MRSTHDTRPKLYAYNSLLAGNDGTNLGAPPHVRIALPETKLSLWVFALTAQLRGCDIMIRLT